MEDPEENDRPQESSENSEHSTPGPVTWKDLLQKARKGDEVALGAVCERLRSYLMLVADEGMGDDLRGKFGASDIVQQSMLEAAQDIDRFSGSTEKEFRIWIKKILHHNLIDVARSFRDTSGRDISREETGSRNLHEQLFANADTPSEFMQRAEADEELARAVQLLPTRKREIIEMRHRDGLSYKEIAEKLNVSEIAARKIWSRAIEDLRRALS